MLCSHLARGDTELLLTGRLLLQQPELGDVFTADHQESVGVPRLDVHPGLAELHLLAQHREGGEVEADSLDDVGLVEVPHLDDRVLAVGEDKSSVHMNLDIDNPRLVSSEDGGWSAPRTVTNCCSVLHSPGSYDGIPESDHHIIAARGEDPDLLSQVEAPYSPGQLEDVAVQLVGDVHDDDGALGVPGAGHHRLVVREILDTIDPVTVETLTWSHLTQLLSSRADLT